MRGVLGRVQRAGSAARRRSARAAWTSPGGCYGDRLGSGKAEEVLDRFVQAGYATRWRSFIASTRNRSSARWPTSIPNRWPLVLRLSAGRHSRPGDGPHGRVDAHGRGQAHRHHGEDHARGHQARGRVLEKKLAAVLRAGVSSSAQVGGLSAIVAILNQTDRASEKPILAELEQSESRRWPRRSATRCSSSTTSSASTTARCSGCCATWSPKDLAVALKGVCDDIREKFLRNTVRPRRAGCPGRRDRPSSAHPGVAGRDGAGRHREGCPRARSGGRDRIGTGR